MRGGRGPWCEEVLAAVAQGGGAAESQGHMRMEKHEG
jgi:hypothetical protein